jgi:hypothetical protein
MPPLACQAVLIPMAQHHPSINRCLICRGPITVHQEVRGGACNDPRCRQALIHLPRQRAQEHRAKVADSLMLAAPDDLPLATVPSYDRSIANLPEKRRRRFRDHLNRQIGLAVKRPFHPLDDSDDSGYPAEIHPTPAQQAALAKACGTCRGYCCSQGGDRAWLDGPAIRSYMAAHSGARPRDILKAYLDRLPQKSCRGSCVYHTSSGCALPRSMRAAICNNHYCAGLRELQAQLAKSESSHALVVAMNRSSVVRSIVVAASEAGLGYDPILSIGHLLVHRPGAARGALGREPKRQPTLTCNCTKDLDFLARSIESRKCGKRCKKGPQRVAPSAKEDKTSFWPLTLAFSPTRRVKSSVVRVYQIKAGGCGP